MTPSPSTVPASPALAHPWIQVGLSGVDSKPWQWPSPLQVTSVHPLHGAGAWVLRENSLGATWDRSLRSGDPLHAPPRGPSITSTSLGLRSTTFTASQMELVVNSPPANAGDIRDAGSIPGSGRSPGEENGTPVFLPGKFHEQRSLAGYSPWSDRVRCDWGNLGSTFKAGTVAPVGISPSKHSPEHASMEAPFKANRMSLVKGLQSPDE